MGFYVTTENPNVMMKENCNTQSCEYIIICQDGLYIASTNPEEILQMSTDKCKINIYIQDKYPHDPGGKDNYQIKEYLENFYENMNILVNDNLPTDLHTAFQISKLLIEKGNLNLIHNKNSYQHFNCLSRKRNWINYIMRCNSWTTKPDFTYLGVHYIHQISSIPALPTSQPPYLQETIYTRIFLHMMRSILNNSNENKQ